MTIFADFYRFYMCQIWVSNIERRGHEIGLNCTKTYRAHAFCSKTRNEYTLRRQQSIEQWKTLCGQGINKRIGFPGNSTITDSFTKVTKSGKLAKPKWMKMSMFFIKRRAIVIEARPPTNGFSVGVCASSAQSTIVRRFQVCPLDDLQAERV